MPTSSDGRAHLIDVFLRPTRDKQVALQDDKDQIGSPWTECGVYHTGKSEWPIPHRVPVPQGRENAAPHPASALIHLCDVGVDSFGFPGVAVEPFGDPAIRASGGVGLGLATADRRPAPIPPPRWLTDKHS